MYSFFQTVFSEIFLICWQTFWFLKHFLSLSMLKNLCWIMWGWKLLFFRILWWIESAKKTLVRNPFTSFPLTISFADTPPLFGLDCTVTAARPPRPPAMSSRIGLRLQLMRDQMQQEEQRERERQQLQQQAASMHYMQHYMPGPPAPSPAICAPTHFQPPMQVPVEVLKVGISISLCDRISYLCI